MSTYSDKDTPAGEPSGHVNNHVFYVKALVDSEQDGDIDQVTLGNPSGSSPGSDVTRTPDEFEKFFAGAITLAVK